MSDAEQKLKTISGSSPANELREAAAKVVKPPVRGEVSLQKLDGTNVYQWHLRRSLYWEPYGQLMILENTKPTHPADPVPPEGCICGSLINAMARWIKREYQPKGSGRLPTPLLKEVADKNGHNPAETIEQIEKDLTTSFEQFRVANDAYMQGTSASSMIAANQFIIRMAAYFDRQNTAHLQAAVQAAESKKQFFLMTELSTALSPLIVHTYQDGFPPMTGELLHKLNDWQKQKFDESSEALQLNQGEK